MKDSLQIYVWKPHYYRNLYDKLLEETGEISRYDENRDPFGKPIQKWKKDILLMLLTKAEEPFPYNSKKVRKRVLKDVERIEEKIFQCARITQ